MPTRETGNGTTDETTNKKAVRVIMGFDVNNPLVGETQGDDTFETLLKRVTEGTEMNPTELRNNGYVPIVSGRVYSYSDNVTKTLSEMNAKEVTYMTKQKGG
jgi:hypothetical protein